MPSEKPHIFEIREPCATESEVLQSDDLRRFLEITRNELGLDHNGIAKDPIMALKAFMAFRKFHGLFSRTEGLAIDTLESLNAILLDKICEEGRTVKFPLDQLEFFKRNARALMARGLVPIVIDPQKNPYGLPVYPSDEEVETEALDPHASIKLVALPFGIKYSDMSKPKSPEEIFTDIDTTGLGFDAKNEASHASFVSVRYLRSPNGRSDQKSVGFSHTATLPRGQIAGELLEQVKQYGCGLFEGIGVEYGDDGDIIIFRLDDHAERMSKGGEFFDMPQIPPEIFRKAVIDTVLANRAYIPPMGKGRLYIRPNWFDIGPKMHVGNSNLHALTVTAISIGSVESYFKPGRKTLFMPNNIFRATQNGMGQTKGIGNYAPTIRVNNRANELGMTGVIYTNEGQDRTEETLASSIIRLIERNGKVVLQTPRLDHNTILDSITRKTVLTLAKEELGWEVEETDISPDNFLQCEEKVLGVYAVGTAAGLAPIHGIRRGDFNNKTGEIENLEEEIDLLPYDASNPMGKEGTQLLDILQKAKTGRLTNPKYRKWLTKLR